MSKKVPVQKSGCYLKIKLILDDARQNVYRHVNSVMVKAYWNIGRIIVVEEQQGERKAEYGVKLISELSVKLSRDFGKGFDERNLFFMRQFYLTFLKLNALRSELSWTHYRLLIRVENEQARDFYINECVQSNWSTRQLERQVNSFYYERLLVSKNKLPVKREAAARAKELSVLPEEQIKDPYILEFLGLKEIPSLKENQLEQALVGHLQKFLLELGRGFSFVARQMRISTETQHFYIDLVFYNYLLKCFVIIDLKTSKLMHQDIGQMDMYVRIFEDKMKQPGDNPTIGIILCTKKDETIVKYSVLKGSKKLFASQYKLYLPSEKELKDEIEREKHILRLSLKEKK
ncbi:MAG: PDDEXK nuclease domain-containing protein [Candidatus Omnitrophota bacterium]